MELLCRCDDIPDDGIELRVLKGLLTAVTSNAVHVHGQALLLVRLTTCGEAARAVEACGSQMQSAQAKTITLYCMLSGLSSHICHEVVMHNVQELPVWQSGVVKWPSI